MVRIRLFVLGACAMSAGTGMLAACSADEPRASFAEEINEASAPEPSSLLPPVDRDAGELDADVAASKPDYDASDEPVVCASTPCVTQLVGGTNHFCALLSDGSIQCWGRDDFGVLGRGETGESNNTGSPPKPVVGITNATQISASSLGPNAGDETWDMTCARDARGRVQCWGVNTYGQLGLQVSPVLFDNAAHATPADVALTAEIARVDVGPYSVCALGVNGDVYCWGYNDQRQLARPDAGALDGPGLADLRKYEITRIVIGRGSVFGLTKNGQLVNWGVTSGRDSSRFYTSVPGLLERLSDVTSVGIGGIGTADDSASCAIAAGSIYCWGQNFYGELGIGGPGWERLPALAPIHTDGKSFPQQLALAQRRSCVRMTDGTIQCCGQDRLGQLGRGDAGTLAPFFERATEFKEHAVQVAVSNDTTCALVQGGKVMCWGGNTNGELGQGTMDSEAHLVPVTVAFQ